MAPHIALHQMGVPFEARPLSFRQRENRTPECLALNPEGKVPTLLVDGRPLTEVATILIYLARRFPEAGLLPRDAEGEAQVLSWMLMAGPGWVLGGRRRTWPATAPDPTRLTPPPFQWCARPNAITGVGCPVADSKFDVSPLQLTQTDPAWQQARIRLIQGQQAVQPRL